ncbi:MAG: hypothetical protein AAFV54_00910 [Pseudomonadota bacterium]
MKLATLSAFALVLPLTAQAQDTLHSGATPGPDVVTSITLEDMRALVENEGHAGGTDLSNGVGITATALNGLTYIVSGKACQDNATCLGVEFMVAFNGDYSDEFANSINQRWSAIKATRSDTALLLSRYLILDGGQTKENLAVNLRNTIAIAEQIQAESTSAQEPVAAPEPEVLAVSDIAWGDDSGDYANDGACDDARFEADGDDWTYQRSHVLRDSTDCRTLYEQGTLTLFLDFGSNNGDYVDDNTCDDNRFTGEGRSILQTDSQVKRDAADCIAAYRAGTINRPT